MKSTAKSRTQPTAAKAATGTDPLEELDSAGGTFEVAVVASVVETGVRVTDVSVLVVAVVVVVVVVALVVVL
eukprot:m.97278 g.97278  ORF g.97278 m.97278 type:complete len:72 (+) comp8817_c0_seq1:409-624(+)